MLLPQSIEDAPYLQRLYEACADYFLLAEGTPPSASAAAEAFTNLPLGVPASAKFVFASPAAGGGAPAALLEGLRNYPQPGVWYVGLLMVLPQLRSSGLGSRVIAEFEALARQAGARELRLCVFDANPSALRFWLRNGFSFHRAIAPQAFGTRTHTRSELRKALGAG
jgi:GNAT superfamily N-acetyltransferase